jgi:uncharacterized protein YbaA (DUF1428 family)
VARFCSADSTAVSGHRFRMIDEQDAFAVIGGLFLRERLMRRARSMVAWGTPTIISIVQALSGWLTGEIIERKKLHEHRRVSRMRPLMLNPHPNGRICMHYFDGFVVSFRSGRKKKLDAPTARMATKPRARSGATIYLPAAWRRPRSKVWLRTMARSNISNASPVDVSIGQVTSFPQSVKLKPGETGLSSPTSRLPKSACAAARPRLMALQGS